MPSFVQLVSALKEQMTANLSRSDALRPLSTLAMILLLAIVACAEVRSPNWLLVVLTCLLGLVILLYIAAYGFFAIKDRDALRSEKYTLNKMAIEHGLLGDSTSGIIELEAMKPKQVKPPVEHQSKEKRDA